MLLPLLLVVAGAVGGQDTGGPYTGTIAVHTGADTQVLHCTVLYCTAHHCTALYCTALFCTALYCVTIQGSCTDNRGQLIQEGRLFEPGPDECQVSTCHGYTWPGNTFLM